MEALPHNVDIYGTTQLHQHLSDVHHPVVCFTLVMWCRPPNHLVQWYRVVQKLDHSTFTKQSRRTHFKKVAIATHCNLQAARHRASRCGPNNLLLSVLACFDQICTPHAQKLLHSRFSDLDFSKESNNLVISW